MLADLLEAAEAFAAFLVATIFAPFVLPVLPFGTAVRICHRHAVPRSWMEAFHAPARAA